MSCLKTFCEKFHHLGFDDKVYTNNRAMKLVNQSKPDGRIQGIIEGTDPSKHFITCFFDENSKNITESKLYVDKNIKVDVQVTKNIDIEELPQLNLNVPATFDLRNGTYLNKLQMVPLYKRGMQHCLLYRDIIRLMVWAKCVGLSFEQFWSWNKQKEDTLKREMKYRKLWVTRYWPTSEHYIEAVLMKFYPNITKNILTRKLIDNFEYVEKNVTVKKIKGLYLYQTCLNPNTKYTILGSNMGSNKTGSIINSLKNKRCLMITSRITLARNVSERMKQEGLNFINYKEFESKEKFEGVLAKYDNVVCGIASLHYLHSNTFDIIIMDESESLLNTFIQNAETHKQFVGGNWSILKHFIQSAEKVYLMDAFTTRLTIDFIKGIDQQAEIDYIDTNPSEEELKSSRRRIIQHETYADWIHEIITTLKAGKKIYIFTSFKSNKKGVNALTNMLIQEFGWKENQEFVAYHGEKSTEKKALGKCEEIWGKPLVRCVITNSCITIGVNFNTKDVFDNVFCLYNSFVGARDVIQALFRVRHPKSKDMHFLHDKSRYRPNYSERVCEPPDCDTYRQLQTNLRIEYFANNYECGLDTFKYFCSRSNIVFDQKKLRHTIRNNRVEVNRIMKRSDVYAKWESIQDITKQEMLEFGEKLNSDNGNLQMRLQFNKFIFKSKFEKVEDAETLWNAKKVDLTYKLVQFIKYPNFIIRRIYDENCMEITENVKSNLKLNSVTLDEVNSTFMFDMKHKSSTRECDLVKKMINSYFGTVITFETTENDKQKYVRQIIDNKQFIKLKTDKTFLKNVKDILDKLKESMFVKTPINKIEDVDIDIDIDEDDIIEWDF